MLVRTCVLAASTMAFVIVAEEFPAEHRGWGIGMVGALGACGFGFGAILFGFVERLPFGWRALYAIGVLPLLAMPRLRRGIPRRAASIATAASVSPTATASVASAAGSRRWSRWRAHTRAASSA